MPRRRIRGNPAFAGGIGAVLREAGVPSAFTAAVKEEADHAARSVQTADQVDLDFVTIDPPGSRDLDQALHVERVGGGGHRVSYAIADVGAFVAPGGPLDADTHARGVTVYAPHAKAPLHPPVLSEGAASLLPGEWRPAVLWTLELDATGEVSTAQVARASVRSVAQHIYSDVPPALRALLQEVGERRMAIEQRRGGVRLNVPEQEVVEEGGGWSVQYRVSEPTEDWNAQISLMTGMAAADLMLRSGVGILRTQPAPSEKALRRLRRQAAALRVPWPDGMSYPDFVRSLDPAAATHAALMHEATGVGRGASYVAFDGSPPSEARHFAIAASYAHATAPLRRLQDRYVSECCLAAASGGTVPDWVRTGLPALPAAMEAADRRAHAVERGVVDLVESLLLAGREGERFEGAVVDDGLVQLRSPAVQAKVEGSPEPGSEVTVRLDRADPAARTVAFSLA